MTLNTDVSKIRLQTLNFLRPIQAGHKLLRIGGEGDGAYLVPDDLKGITSCYSPGVSNKKPFEDELLDKFDIGSHMCDFTSDAEKLLTPLVPNRQTFEKKSKKITHFLKTSS